MQKELIKTPAQITHWLNQQLSMNGFQPFLIGRYFIIERKYNPDDLPIKEKKEDEEEQKREMDIRFSVKEKGDICYYETTIEVSVDNVTQTKINGKIRGTIFNVEMIPEVNITTVKNGKVYIFPPETYIKSMLIG